MGWDLVEFDLRDVESGSIKQWVISWELSGRPLGSVRAIKGPWLDLNVSLHWLTHFCFPDQHNISRMCVYCVYMFNHTFFGCVALWQSFSSIMQSTICITIPPWAIISKSFRVLKSYMANVSMQNQYCICTALQLQYDRLKSRTGLENKDTSFYSDNWHANLVFDIKTSLLQSRHY